MIIGTYVPNETNNVCWRVISASWFGLANEIAGIGVERFRHPAKNAHACRNIGALDLTDVARTDAGAICQLLLRQLLVMAQPT